MTSFKSLFGHESGASAEASGRVNLIGEHTDYNGGFVFPTGIPQLCRVELSARSDSRVRVFSKNQDAGDHQIFEYGLGEERLGHTWTDYVQGVTKILLLEGFKIAGFDARIDSSVPMGSGLSSSAALEVSLMRALRSAFHLTLDDLRIARLSQKVENDFVGARVGIMDQMAASLASAGDALFLDTQDLSYRKVPLPLHLIELVVINSGIAHRNVDGGYNRRRAECEEACRILKIDSLRELHGDGLAAAEKQLPPLNFRRVRHVVSENVRVLDAVGALENEDFESFGMLLNASHASLQHDFEVSIPEIDQLVEITRRQPGVYGARMTGGGFGGSIVAVVEKGFGASVARAASAEYLLHVGHRATVLVPEGLLALAPLLA